MVLQLTDKIIFQTDIDLRLSDTIIYPHRYVNVNSWGGIHCKGVTKMVDDGTKITIRVSNDDIQLMEDYMAEHGIENRSDFIRDAIRDFIASSKTPENSEANAIVVPLNPVVIQTLENMKTEGIIHDEASYIRELVNAEIIPKEAIEESKARAFRAAQQSSRIM